MSQSILVIGNNGDFAKHVHALLCDHSNYDSLILLDKNNLDVDFYLKDIAQRISEANMKWIVYLGGEISNADRMHFANYALPRAILEFCHEKNLKFAYLSSLAALGTYVTGVVTVDNVNKLQPKDLYGKSKFDFDSWLSLDSKFRKRTLCLYPASIIGVNHKTSSIQKVICALKKYKFLKFFCFYTVITFCTREEIAKVLEVNITNDKVGNIIVANNALISDLNILINGNHAIINISFLLSFLWRIRRFIPESLLKKLTSLYSHAIYAQQNESCHLLSLKELSEYLSNNRV